MEIKIEASWKEKLQNEFKKDYFNSLIKFLQKEYQYKKIYPLKKDIFKAFKLCPFDKTKIVIIGQDPYHGDNQANGLCFSVNNHITIPPSLANIFKEIKDDLAIPIPTSGNLERWAKQGVLLLNAILTVHANEGGSHQGKGWERFTDMVIKILSENKKNIVFILWGAYAQSKGKIIDKHNHLVLKSVHPSPLAAHKGFWGNNHFSKTNKYLIEKEMKIIEW